MAGWFEAFSDFARGAAPALDRYQMLRQLDTDNQFKKRQQDIQEQLNNQRMQLAGQEQADQARMRAKQVELLDQSILNQKQDDFAKFHMPGQSLDQSGYEQAGQVGFGGLVQNRPKIDFESMDLAEPDFAGNAQQGLTPPEMEHIYQGTPQQQQQDQQRKMLMQIITGLQDPTQRAQAALGQNITRPPVDPYRTPIAIQGGDYKAGTMVDPRTAVDEQLQRFVPPQRPTGGGGGGGSNRPPIDMDLVERGATAVLEGRFSPSQAAQLYGGMGGEGAAYKRAITDRVLQLNPKYSGTEAESNYVYGKSPGTQTTVRFMDNIKNTIPMMRDMVKKMNLADIKVFNSISLGASGQFGKGEVAAYDFMSTILGDEIAKILQGGGTGSATSDAKLKQAMDLIGRDMSPDQWGQVLDAADEMLKVRRGSMTKGTYMQDKDRKYTLSPDGVYRFEAVTTPTTTAPSLFGPKGKK